MLIERLKSVGLLRYIYRKVAVTFRTSKLFCQSRSTYLGLLVVAIISIASQNAFAQTTQAASDAEVSALLAQIETNNETRSIFDINSRSKIADITRESSFKVVSSIDEWRIIEFAEPTIEVWVSREYVDVVEGKVRVSVSSLSAYGEPNFSSPVLLEFAEGDKAKLVGRKNGFVGLLAPTSYHVATFLGDDAQAQQNILALSAAATGQDQIQSTEIQSTENLATENGRANAKLLSQSSSNVEIQDETEGDFALATASSTSSERLHVIAPGDAISLLVFGETDLSIENVRVPQSGRVAFPLIGSVLVAGQTIPQIERSVAQLLAQGYVKNPRLSVTIFSYRPVFIRGAIQQTGSFPFSEGLTIGKLIALAGGSKKSAKRNGVSILREGKVVEQALAIDSLIEVQSGDVISIEEEIGVQEDDATYIYLHGEVASPGEYQFRRGLTVEKAIVLAGGFTLRGSRKKISVTRYSDIEGDEAPKKLKKVKLYTQIKPGDIINVGASWF